MELFAFGYGNLELNQRGRVDLESRCCLNFLLDYAKRMDMQYQQPKISAAMSMTTYLVPEPAERCEAQESENSSQVGAFHHNFNPLLDGC